MYIARLTGNLPPPSEVTVDWQEPMVLRPSIARADEQPDPRQQLANTPPPQSTTPGLHSVSIYQMAPPEWTSDCSLLGLGNWYTFSSSIFCGKGAKLQVMWLKTATNIKSFDSVGRSIYVYIHRQCLFPDAKPLSTLHVQNSCAKGGGSSISVDRHAGVFLRLNII